MGSTRKRGDARQADKLRQMPGNACRFFRAGRCLYEERLNPGYNGSWRCVVVRSWEREYDEFVQRAEAFGLEDDAAGSIWERRFAEMMRAGVACDRFERGGEYELLACVHLMGDLCLCALPPCDGVCGRFQPRGRRMKN
ncbi:hypothetical protein dsat_0927 [Alkalidesulfovibrio alkalitolerans DSM 16529]|uniref:Uncharacterized protein n=1 Tax=Alkalidesulfovibrio alkalitolerans DSM 16529 TaxID=1121439 RepID=S7UH65_9BACT|nr:hypothetical protein [Alkalidesulfovibrio alkalitolerans]EPR31603.1 hypothetical protein dsat_0927 [Alkalidesulfovibrio alkalitolerans DSM 16529]